ncbi:hypothetical protein [Candidatus Lokiarchaeum ossiferum]
MRREHYNVGRYDDVQKDYVQHDKKNSIMKMVDKLVPFILFGGIFLMWILVFNRA